MNKSTLQFLILSIFTSVTLFGCNSQNKKTIPTNPVSYQAITKQIDSEKDDDNLWSGESASNVETNKMPDRHIVGIKIKESLKAKLLTRIQKEGRRIGLSVMMIDGEEHPESTVVILIDGEGKKAQGFVDFESHEFLNIW
jgi:hypothetical protein